MSEQKLYTDKQGPFVPEEAKVFIPGKSRVFTRQQAIEKIVYDWNGKYGITAEGAARELDDDEAAELRELTKSEYKRLSDFHKSTYIIFS